MPVPEIVPEIVVDLTDEQLRRRADAKWSMVPDDVLPAWVAEMDFGLAPVVAAALHDAIDRGAVGYPTAANLSGVAEALSGFADRRWGWAVDPGQVVLVPDTMGGVGLALTQLCADAPVVVPTPAYPPFLAAVPHAGRELVTVALDPDAERATLDLEAIDAAFAAGARTLLLCQPHNPWGRVFTRPELEALRDVVARHGARVVADEVHGPLVLPGSRHQPYAAIEGTAEHTTTVTSAAKGWNIPGLKSGQIVATPADAKRLRALPLVVNHGSSGLGQVAAVAAYAHGEGWLDAVVRRIDANRWLFAELVADLLPHARLRTVEATYLAWLDARAYRRDGGEEPGLTALTRGRVRVNEGSEFGPGGAGHVRVNLATSAERLQRVVQRLASAWVA